MLWSVCFMGRLPIFLQVKIYVTFPLTWTNKSCTFRSQIVVISTISFGSLVPGLSRTHWDLDCLLNVSRRQMPTAFSS